MFIHIDFTKKIVLEEKKYVCILRQTFTGKKFTSRLHVIWPLRINAQTVLRCNVCFIQ